MLSHIVLADVKEWEHKRITQVEAVIAAYFLIDSIYDILNSQIGEEWSDRAMILDVFINLVAYIFEVYFRWKEHKEVGDDFDIIDHIRRIENAKDGDELDRYKNFENENQVV